MFFRQILHDKGSCASYIIGCQGKGVAAIIDPLEDTQRYVDEVEKNGMKISHIIETHIHADHVSGARKLQRLLNVPIFLHESAKVNYPFEPLKDKEIFNIGNRIIKVLHTPGHTEESITFLVDDWFVLTGDTLFVGDVGRVDLVEDFKDDDVRKKAGKLYDSIQKLISLPDYIEVYPAHYSGSSCGKYMDGKPISSIGREKIANHAISLSDKKKFIEFLTTDLPKVPKNFINIKKINSGLL